MSEIEKKIEELSNKPPEVPPALIQGFETKFKDFEKNMEELKKTVESKAIDENALVEKIAEVVVERIRPGKRNRPCILGRHHRCSQPLLPYQPVSPRRNINPKPIIVRSHSI